MRLIQYITNEGQRGVAAIVDENLPRQILDTTSTYDLAIASHRAGQALEESVTLRGLGAIVDYDALLTEGRILPPLDHPDPTRMMLSLTGLTHVGSAQSRDTMHARLNSDNLTDSMKMFKMGLEGGRPEEGHAGVQPEWGYKGDGYWLVPPGGALECPAFALDGGEEGEIAGLYVIGEAGEVLRVGFALANEFSDHVMERQNYLFLAHSKLRTSSFGPELLIGHLPTSVHGSISVIRGDALVWRSEMASGEENMCHSIANLEAHHFKYARFRRPGDVHVHYFGASGLSCSAGIGLEPGDVVEISAEGFGRPLRNSIRLLKEESVPRIVQL